MLVFETEVLQFGLYKKFVDKLFKEETGHNVQGFKKPTGEVKRRIIFNGQKAYISNKYVSETKP